MSQQQQNKVLSFVFIITTLELVKDLYIFFFYFSVLHPNNEAVKDSLNIRIMVLFIIPAKITIRFNFQNYLNNNNWK